MKKTFLLTIALLSSICCAHSQMVNILNSDINNSHYYFGEIILCETNGGGHKAYIEYAKILVTADGTVRCTLQHTGGEGRNPHNPLRKNSDEWRFEVGSLKETDTLVTGELYNISLTDTNSWAYIDSSATGTYTYDKISQIETLEIKFSIYNYEMNEVIKWKTPATDLAGRTYRAQCELTDSKKNKKRYRNRSLTCELKFDADKVTVSYYATDASGENKDIVSEETYKYMLGKKESGLPENKLAIPEFVEYSWFNLFNSRLMGMQPKNEKSYDHSIVWFDWIESEDM